MDRGEIRAAWQDGQSLEEMAEAKGVSRTDLVTTITDAIDDQLTKLVDKDRISADRKAEILAKIGSRIESGIDLHKGDLRDSDTGGATPASTSIESIAF